MKSAPKFRLRPLAAAIASCVTVTGCGVLFTTGSPGKLNEKKDAIQYSPKELTAVTYYLPKDVLEVEAQIDSQVISSLEYPDNAGTPDADQKPVKVTQTPISKLERFDSVIVTIPDRNKPFLIDANSPGFYKNDSSINVSESGLLESINTKTTGSGGAVVQNVLKLAGTVLPFVKGVPPLKPSPSAKVAYAAPDGEVAWRSNLESTDNQRSFVRGRFAADSCVNPDSPIDTPAEVKAFTEQYFGDRIELRYALPDLADKRRLKRDFCTTFKLAESRKAELNATSQSLAGASGLDLVRTLTLRLRFQRPEVDRAIAAHQAARDALNAAVAEKLAEEGIGTVKNSTIRKFILDLEKLPDTATLESEPAARKVKEPADPCNLVKENETRDVFGPRQLSEIEAFVSKSTYPVANELFTKTRTIVSLESVQRNDSDLDNLPRNWANYTQTSCDRRSADANACIFYREPVLYRLKVWLVKKDPDKSTDTLECVRLQPPQERLLLLVSSKAPIRALDLPANIWTKRDTAITFNARGRLLSVQRNFGSAAEDSTAAVQQGIRGGITEYETSLTSIKNIGATKNAIQLQPLEQQLAVAQKQLELIKANTSLQAASSSSQALLDTELAGIEKSLLEAQQQLLAAQTQLTTDTANAGDLDAKLEQAAANAKIAAQIQDLKNQIDLLKLESELKALREGGGGTP